MSDMKIINDEGLDILFRKARTYNGWLDQEVSDVLLKALHDLMKWGPTSANCSPMRLVFVKTPEAKERLKPYLMEGNVEKTMQAPVTAILAQDMKFYDHLPKLFPHTDAKSWFEGRQAYADKTASLNANLQGGYFIMAARALGLDCGPMSGIKAKGIKNEFFADKDYAVSFVCNLGYGDKESLHPRSPRFEFDEIAEII